VSAAGAVGCTVCGDASEQSGYLLLSFAALKSAFLEPVAIWLAAWLVSGFGNIRDIGGGAVRRMRLPFD
jgi:hypothetical protein